jgi:hypothetical protein
VIADRNMLRAMELGWTPETGVNYYDFLAQRGEGPAPITGDPRLNSSTGGIQNLLQGLFSGAPSQGGGDQGFRFSQGTTTFTGYDPETDSFTGTIGGIAGSSPFSIPRSMATPELMQAYEQYQARANNSLPGMDQRSRYNLPNMPGGMPGPAMPGQMPGTGFPGYSGPSRTLYPGMGAGSGGVRTMEFIDVNRNGIDDRDEVPKSGQPNVPGGIGGMLGSMFPGQAPGSPATGFNFRVDNATFTGYNPETDSFTGSIVGFAGSSPFSIPRSMATPELIKAYESYQAGGYGNPTPVPLETTTYEPTVESEPVENPVGAPGGMGGDSSGMLDQPPASDYTYVPSITRADSRMDPITQQLLFGLGGEGGFIPGAMRAARSTFFDEQGRARVIPKEIAGFSPDEVRAFELARDVPTVMDPYIRRAEEAYKRGLGEFDPSTGIQPYMDPFEDAVVKQTMSDIMEAGAQRDISARAGDIARGGESAFGSRARLGAAERERALGRGLGEAIGALRSRGFEGARSAAMGEFARNQMGERGFGGFLSGLGTQKQGGLLSGIGALTGTGGLQRGMTQADLDARREAAMQGQAAPLSMYQALSPFINMAPRGTTSFNTQFGVPPNPLTTGIGTALSALAAFGDYFGGLGSLSGGQQRTT